MHTKEALGESRKNNLRSGQYLMQEGREQQPQGTMLGGGGSFPACPDFWWWLLFSCAH